MFRAAIFTLLSLLTFNAAAQPLHFSQYAPLTNTRYGSEPGIPELVAVGRELLLVWSTPNNVRVARYTEGEKRVAQMVMESYQRDADAVATGSTVLVAATFDGYANALMGRQLDANGNPIGDVFLIKAGAFEPKMAWNGQRLLLLYKSSNGVRLAVLSSTGRQILEDRFLGPDIFRYDIASNGTGFTAITATESAVRAITFDANGANVSTTSLAGPRVNGTVPREVAIASDGDDYLAVWTEGTSISAADVSSSGTASSAVVLENTTTITSAGAPSVIWAGDHYEVAYRAMGVAAEVRLLNVSGGSTVAQRIANLPSSATTRTSLARAEDGRTHVAWTAGGMGAVRVRATNGTDEGEAASFGATEQTLMSSATASGSIMFVWYEMADEQLRTHIGFRDRLGSWIERALGTNLNQDAIAASNGTDFMVVTSNATDWLAYRITAAGTVSGQPSKISTRANVRSFDEMIWNGKAYILAGVDGQGRVIAASLSTSGVLNPPTVVRTPRTGITLENPAIASDGTNTLMAWNEIEATPCFPICDFAIDGINAQLLGPDLQLLGESALMIVDNDAGPPRVVVTTEYVIVWGHTPANQNTGSIRAQRMGRDGKRAGPAFEVIATGVPFDVEALSLPLGFAVVWAEATKEAVETHVIQARPDGVVTQHTKLPAQRYTSTLFTLLPDRRFAHAISISQTPPPHHGASRIFLSIGDVVTPIALPGAPLLTVIGTSTTAELSWTPPSGAVNGYRLEYRIGDGAWNELDRFHGPEQTTASIRLSGNRNITFRVRAFNDAGAGEYSAIRGPGQPKRRVVRR